ncbi:hypothetical protein P4O66_017003 [Electrophorus voltai]|uniref:CYRIA/CYRIB Rac1 binding domain-containing protein n=1 Tax=Electrophorus voltai TaxID=2609070 RepID=A0AAD8YSV9_9TELE|nr:hypothetical protein P4O66_017003 [Electrophorus voltai]
MGNLIKVLTRDIDNNSGNFFLDFENAQPTEAEKQQWEQVNEVLMEAQGILQDLQSYSGAGEAIRQLTVNRGRNNGPTAEELDSQSGGFYSQLTYSQRGGALGSQAARVLFIQAIQQPNDERVQETAWAAVVPLVNKLKKFYEFSVKLEGTLHGLLGFLTSAHCSPTQHLEQEQALARQFAEILHFTLRFDELKVRVDRHRHSPPTATPAPPSSYSTHAYALLHLGTLLVIFVPSKRSPSPYTEERRGERRGEERRGEGRGGERGGGERGGEERGGEGRRGEGRGGERGGEERRGERRGEEEKKGEERRRREERRGEERRGEEKKGEERRAGEERRGEGRRRKERRGEQERRGEGRGGEEIALPAETSAQEPSQRGVFFVSFPGGSVAVTLAGSPPPSTSVIPSKGSHMQKHIQKTTLHKSGGRHCWQARNLCSSAPGILEFFMTNPAIQNDFSYYRRTLSRMRINNMATEEENEVNNELANRMSLFYANATPMLKTLSDATTKFVSENSDLPIENTTDCLSTMASVCKVMLETPEYRSRFASDDTVLFCLRVMVGVIILYDYVHPAGAFIKSSKIDMKGCIKVLRDQPPNRVEGLLNALRYTTKHLHDETTSKQIKNMLQG